VVPSPQLYQAALKDTMIIFTSDHGDYLGDHWQGEKLYFHDPSVRVPLIIYDPSSKADATRGTVDSRLTEAIDLVPTIVDFMGGEVRDHILEGRSLLPLLHGETPEWRDCAFSEADFSRLPARVELDRPTTDCSMIMAYDGRWKYIYCQGMRPMLFDLKTDPQEFTDLGADPAYEQERQRLQARVLDWTVSRNNRVTQSTKAIEEKVPEYSRGVFIGFWDEQEVAEAHATKAKF